MPENYMDASSLQETMRDVLKFNNARLIDLVTIWDKNQDGLIQRKEFVDGLLRLNIPGANKSEYKVLFNFFDLDGNKSLELRELKKALESSTSVAEARDVLSKRAADKRKADANGRVNAIKSVRVKTSPRKPSGSAQEDDPEQSARSAAIPRTLDGNQSASRTCLQERDVDSLDAPVVYAYRLDHGLPNQEEPHIASISPAAYAFSPNYFSDERGTYASSGPSTAPAPTKTPFLPHPPRPTPPPPAMDEWERWANEEEKTLLEAKLKLRERLAIGSPHSSRSPHWRIAPPSIGELQNRRQQRPPTTPPFACSRLTAATTPCASSCSPSSTPVERPLLATTTGDAWQWCSELLDADGEVGSPGSRLVGRPRLAPSLRLRTAELIPPPRTRVYSCKHGPSASAPPSPHRANKMYRIAPELSTTAFARPSHRVRPAQTAAPTRWADVREAEPVCTDRTV